MKVVGYEDYIDRLHQEFPDVTRNSIKEILRFGTGKMLYYKKSGKDLFLKDDVNLKFYMYVGEITTNTYKRNGIYFTQKRRKLRHMYALDKRQYDGYYYLGMTNEQLQSYRENSIIDSISLYKVQEEALINPLSKHLFRVKVETPTGWRILKENYKDPIIEYIKSKPDASPIESTKTDINEENNS